MKQVVQNLKSGELEVIDVPCPLASRGHLLIRTRATLISAGTELSVVEFGQASLAAKARRNPERVRQVLDRIKNDGLLPTLELVFAKLNEPMPLGYCNAGEILEVGPGVTGYQVGDRVVSNGRHAELVNKPLNLCAKIPQGVSDEQATFAVLGSIGLQGIRLLEPTIGERVAVFGLGLIGLTAVQLLQNAGAHVLGIDVDPGRLALARKFGAHTVDVPAGADPVAAGLAFSEGAGLDAVLITASAKNDSIVSQAARMSRKRGRIVLVGVVNLQLNRAEFYEKELKIQVSCSYGPGRYDPQYEDQGQDYPLPFVRWTEQRNMQAILELLATGRLDVAPLITSRIPLAEAARAYQLLAQDKSQVGIILDYPRGEPPLSVVMDRSPERPPVQPTPGNGRSVVGVIGAGNYTKLRLLPELKRSGATLSMIASASGVTAALAAREYNFRQSTTNYREILADATINTVFITTRHDLHVPMAVEALEAGKHVLVEKPAAIDRAGLARLRAAVAAHPGQQFVVGFNRRYSTHAQTIRRLLAGRSQPVTANVLFNAGYLPGNNWTHDPRVGGGRILGEACHSVDFLRYVVDRPIVAVQAAMIGPAPGVETRGDKMSISLVFADGSLANVHYFANGPKSFTKERAEFFCEERALLLDNFRRLSGVGWPKFRKQNFWSQEKGRTAEISGFIQRVAHGGDPFMPADEIWNVTEACLAAEESAASGRRLELPLEPCPS